MKHISRITVAKAQDTTTPDIFTKVTECIGTFQTTLTDAYNSVLGAFDALLACLLPAEPAE